MAEAEPVDPGAFVEALHPALRQAAAIARALEGRVENEPKEGEARAAKAALTIADTASQEAILVPLLEHFPTVCVQAEEDTATAARFPADAPDRVVVDPIDGTLHCYLGRRGPYAVMVGLARRDAYEAALVALPREGLILDAIRGGGARETRGDAPPRAACARPEGARILVSPELPGPVAQRLRALGYEPCPASGGAIAVAPLLPGVRGGLRLAVGRPSISVRGRIGLLIAREAGATALGPDGATFPDDLHTPVDGLAVAADERALADLVEALRYIPV